MPSLRDRFQSFLGRQPTGLRAPRAKSPLQGAGSQPQGTPLKDAAATISVRVDDSSGWESHNHAPGDRPWADVYADLEDALTAWRKSFMIRRVVNLTRSYVVGSGISITSANTDVAAFVTAFWDHPKNRIARRLGPICDTLTRDGELFPILFTNLVDGMSYLRFKTARQIREVITDPQDYEHELSYTENLPAADDRTWISPHHPSAFPSAGAGELGSRGAQGGEVLPSPSAPLLLRPSAPLPPLPPVMLHWAVNKPIDATRGESDLTPILPWALRYSEWLKDRVRLNRQRTRAAMLDIMVADDTQVEAKRQQLRTSNPVVAGIYVHGPGEEVTMHALNINAGQAEEDGKVLRLAIATGSNLALHYLGEGESTNYSTAKEMGEPTARFFADRQQDIIWALQDLLTVAYRRFCLITGIEPPEDLELQVTVTEVARADNESLAKAAHSIIQALAIASARAWIDDETALAIALKFSGEVLPIDRIRDILTKAREEYDDRPRPEPTTTPPKPADKNGDGNGDENTDKNGDGLSPDRGLDRQDPVTSTPYILNPNRPDEPKFDQQPEDA